MSETPRTEAGRILLAAMAGDPCDCAAHDYGIGSILAIEAEAASEPRPEAPGLDVERLRRAVDTVREKDPLTYLDDGDEVDAIAAEYAVSPSSAAPGIEATERSET